jgi:NADH pyrophosphatase NudC (nudix superfamily)
LKEEFAKKQQSVATTTSATAGTATENDGAASAVSEMKKLAIANVGIYTTPLENHEIAGGEEMIKEKKFKFCGQCGKSAKEVGKNNLSKCDRCRCVRYCSVDCQRANWKEHKQICKKNRPAF